MAWRVLWIALAACLVLLGTTSLARADPIVCVVRVGRPTDDAVLKRILGQTSDLPISIARVAEPIEADREAARARSLALARSKNARAVVWFTAAGRGDIVIFVLDAEERRLFVHRVDKSSGSPSAVLETSSLIVRDILMSLLEGRPIGHRFEPAVRDPHEALAPPLVIGIDPVPVAPLALAPHRGDPFRPFTSFGVRTVLSHSRPSFALDHRVGLARGPLEGGLELTLGALDVRTDPVASLLIRRHALGAFAGWRWNFGQLSATADVHAGAVFFLRSTRAIVSYLLASASTVNVHGYVGPEARITWAPRGPWPRIAIGAGADFVFSPPAFRYEGTTGRAVRQLALWPFQPYLTASLEFGLFR